MASTSFIEVQMLDKPYQLIDSEGEPGDRELTPLGEVLG